MWLFVNRLYILYIFTCLYVQMFHLMFHLDCVTVSYWLWLFYRCSPDEHLMVSLTI